VPEAPRRDHGVLVKLVSSALGKTPQ
jgi:hypothetical protein